MILVTLGTQDKKFDRLLDAIQKEIEKGNIREKVIVQAGYTKYESDKMEIFDLIDTYNFNKLIDECRILITHGGVGTIISGLKKNKKIIAAARLKKYLEHDNDHQLQIIKYLKDNEYILSLDNFEDLDIVLKKIDKFEAKKFNSNTKNMVDIVSTFIDNN